MVWTRAAGSCQLRQAPVAIRGGPHSYVIDAGVQNLPQIAAWLQTPSCLLAAVWALCNQLYISSSDFRRTGALMLSLLKPFLARWPRAPKAPKYVKLVGVPSPLDL